MLTPEPAPDGTPGPSEFGLPEKFADWRPGQWGAVQRILDSPKRFFVLCMPTGGGKSPLAMAAAVLSGKRSVFLTSTRGLADQYQNDFGEMSCDIRGMGNYRCVRTEDLKISRFTTVADAPCQMGYKCPARTDLSCEYHARYRQAQKSPIVVTNFSCWMYDAMKESGGIHIPRWEYEVNREHGLGDTDPRTPIDMLICDEADLAGGWVSKYVGVDISRSECLALRLVWPDAGLVLNDWHGWAAELVDELGARVKAMEKSIRERARAGRGDAWSAEYRMLRDFQRKLQRLATIQADDDWVLDERMSEDAGAGRSLKAIRFEPLMPGRYAEQVLWRGVEKVVLMSATVRPKTANLLGIGTDEMEFAEYPSTFDPKRRPVIFVPSIMMNFRNEQDDKLMHLHLARVDQIIKGRLDRKGVIHAVSYRRAEFIRDNSEYGQYMIVHNSHNRTEAVERFKSAAAPCILVSPSVDTGYDFSGELARYVIIAKIPFASTQDKVVKARQERDPEYGLFIAAQTVVQMSGRAVRCFDLETEILTIEGWKNHKNIKLGDVTYGIDPIYFGKGLARCNASVKLLPNPIRAVQIGDRPEPITRLYSSKGVDIGVTPDHTMAVLARKVVNGYLWKSGRLMKLPADELPARFKILGAGCVSRKGVRVGAGGRSFIKSRDWFRLMGIIISDGHIHPEKSAVTITQSKPKGKIWISELVKRLGLEACVYTDNTAGTPMQVRGGKIYIRNYDKTNWVFSGPDAARIRDVFWRGASRRYSSHKSYRKRSHKGTHGYERVDGWKDVERTIPRWVIERASANQMEALIEGLMEGDGTWNRRGTGAGVYFTASVQLADRLQEVLALSGYKSSLSTRRGQYEVSFCAKCFTDCVKKTVVKRAKEAKTWCVTTELGTVVARRGGKTFIAGNSADDWAETFIVDDNWRWFRHKVRAFVPQWWLDAVQDAVSVPPPLNPGDL